MGRVRSLADIENKAGTAVQSKYAYTVNAIGQRTNLTTSGDAFAAGAAPALAWQYDALGQLEQADSSITGQDRAYQYDDIGNREKAINGLATALPAAPLNYVATATNQYSTANAVASVHYDDDGNISEYLATSGATVAHYEYDPFGNIVLSSGLLKNSFAYRFSTKPLDSVTGLYYYGYRWYDPLTGRWPSRDPIEEMGGVNLYGFLRNQAS